MAIKAGSRLFVDTNILVYATNTRSPFHMSAQSALDRARDQGVTLALSSQVLREYLAVITRPQPGEASEIPFSQAIENVRIIQQEFDVVEESRQILDYLLRLLETVPVRGKQIHDANIVATMQAHGICDLLTHNTADFARFAYLITLYDL